MRLIVLLSRFPYPLEKGDKLRAYHQLKEFSKHFDVYLFCLSSREVHKNEKAHLLAYCKEIHVFKLKYLQIIWRLLISVFNKKPFQVNYFHHPRIERKIDIEIQRIKPNHIFCQMVRVTEYVKKYSFIDKSLDYMDALSKGMERRIEISPFWVKPFAKMEQNRLMQYEQEIAQKYQNLFIISEQDKKYLQVLSDKEMVVSSNGIDLSFWSQKQIMDKKYDLVFVGNMNYPPNVLGVQYLIKKVIPLLLGWGLTPKTLIAGANPSHLVKSLNSETITVSGWMDDIREAYWQSKIFVAPMFVGSGMQNKILEALAMKIPCITSSMAAKAIGARHSKELLIADSPEEFSSSIASLLQDEQLYEQLQNQGFNFIKKHFSWEKEVYKIADLIKSQ